MGGAVRIGTSGYQYAHWRGVLYPEGLPVARWLERYAERFGSLEIDSTFYRLPSAEVFAAWRRRLPPGFVCAVKMSRFATHMKHLRDPEQTLGRFAERAVALGPALGPILVQLPPRWHADPERLAAFLDARAHTPLRRHRFAVEVRHPSWLDEAVYDVLARRGAALVIHDLLPAHPRVLTTDWTYLRFHGAGGAIAGTYQDRELANEARWIARQLAQGRDVYAYFNNDREGHAVRDAERLARLVRSHHRAPRARRASERARVS